jgi:RimJ/RimL family protein N-acetyltransferase
MMIDHTHLRCDMGIIIHHPYWRAGFATEAIFLAMSHGPHPSILLLHSTN